MSEGKSGLLKLIDSLYSLTIVVGRFQEDLNKEG